MMGTANPFSRPQQSYYQPMNMNTYAMPMVYGKMVNSEADILPNQIPNDGSASYFPSSDGSKIYFRAWQQDGKIMSKTYILEDVIASSQMTQTPQNMAVQPQTSQTQPQQPVLPKVEENQLATVLTQLSNNMNLMADRLANLEKTFTE